MICDDSVQVCARLNASAEAHGWPIRCGCGDGFCHDELQALCELWQSKATNGVPPRAAFDMRTLQPFARHLMILEREGMNGAARYRFRLFGSTLTFLFGEHTNRILDEMVLPELLPSWTAFYDTVLSCRQPLRILTYYRTNGDGYLRGEIFAAPMADESGEVRMILAATKVNLQDSVLPPFD